MAQGPPEREFHKDSDRFLQFKISCIYINLYFLMNISLPLFNMYHNFFFIIWKVINPSWLPTEQCSFPQITPESSPHAIKWWRSLSNAENIGFKTHLNFFFPQNAIQPQERHVGHWLHSLRTLQPQPPLHSWHLSWSRAEDFTRSLQATSTVGQSPSVISRRYIFCLVGLSKSLMEIYLIFPN